MQKLNLYFVETRESDYAMSDWVCAGQSYELHLELWVLSNSGMGAAVHTTCLAFKADGAGPMSIMVMVQAN